MAIIAKKQTQTIVIPGLDKNRFTATVVGDTSLICHAWSEKAKKQMLAKQRKEAKSKAHDIREPEQEFRESLYKYDDDSYGFPAIAFKAAMVTAANDVGIQKTLARRAFHIMGATSEESGTDITMHRNDLVKIIGPPPQLREDIVRLGGPSRPADLRYRGEFLVWKCHLNIVYNAGVISKEQILNLLQIAGFGVGVGEWRPEKDGMSGMFHIAEGDQGEPL